MKRLFDLIISPSEEIYRMSRCDPGLGGIAVLIFAILSCIIAVGLLTGIPDPLISFMLTWSMVVRTVLGVFFIFVISAIYHYFASIYGGTTDPGRVFKAMLYTLAPFCFLVPAALISRAWGGMVFYVLFFLGALAYVVVLQFKTISYFYGLSSSRSAAVLFLPWIIFFGTAVFSVLVLSAGIVSSVL